MRWPVAVVCAVLAALFCLPYQYTTQQAASLGQQSPAETPKSESSGTPTVSTEQKPAPGRIITEETPAEPDRTQGPTVLAEQKPLQAQSQTQATEAPKEPVLELIVAGENQAESEKAQNQTARTEQEPSQAQVQTKEMPDESAPEHAAAHDPQPRQTPQAAIPDAPSTAPTTTEARHAPTHPQGATGDGKTQTVRLFNTAAFRGNFKALPKWQRVLSKVTAQVAALNSCTGGTNCPPGSTSWQRIIGQARGKEPMEQLRMVNVFFNKWPYRLDLDAYGQSDWWATPQEFLKLSGDCEDYAITKYFALRELGYTKDSLRIVALKDRIRNIGHAVLVVFMGDTAYVLDNLSGMVSAHDRFTHYIPLYSVNEEYRWAHIPLVKKP